MDMSALVRAAQDPALIPGIYDTCDQWCTYCPATARCLVWRFTPRTTVSRESVGRDVAKRLFEGVMLLKRLWVAEGRETAAVDEFLSADPPEPIADVAHDPLVQMAERYLELSSAYLATRHDFPVEMKRRPTGPTPFEIFTWYGALLAAKVYRALVSSARATCGDVTFRHDALASAKVALIGMDRSIDALSVMPLDGDDPRLRTLQALLRRLRQDVERRFPDARMFVRPGLDPVPDAAHGEPSAT